MGNASGTSAGSSSDPPVDQVAREHAVQFRQLARQLAGEDVDGETDADAEPGPESEEYVPRLQQETSRLEALKQRMEARANAPSDDRPTAVDPDESRRQRERLEAEFRSSIQRRLESPDSEEASTTKWTPPAASVERPKANRRDLRAFYELGDESTSTEPSSTGDASATTSDVTNNSAGAASTELGVD